MAGPCVLTFWTQLCAGCQTEVNSAAIKGQATDPELLIKLQMVMLAPRLFNRKWLSDVLANQGHVSLTTLSSLTRPETMGTGLQSCYFSLFANSGHSVASVPATPGCRCSKPEPGIKTRRGFGR